MDNLPELRDIHIPEGVSMFPPAYGWGVILASVILLVILYKTFSILRQKSKKRYALKMLGDVNTSNVVENAVQMSEVLRRICVFKYKEAAALFDNEWIEFLNSKAKQKISGKAAELLADAPYMAKNSKKFGSEELAKLRTFCKNWVGENL
ncbi:MAG: DUF4381 domain-containing protein [Lactobacillus sp.]|jgi:hypothetical protein|nr:DUF4381 domain-containing protein [Lactobacillus sp.]